MEISKYQNFKEFKERLDRNLEQQAAGFVEAGYLLKVARDTDILKESGYKTVAEFAQAEYGFTKDLVSRYIGINDKFSRDGYSEELDDKYKGFGFTKLAEMLSLPDSIIEEISPTLTRAQIQEVKKEVKEEEKISDIEVLMEEKKAFENEVYAFMYYYLNGKKEIFDKLSNATSKKRQFEILAPNGSALLITRVPGTGKLMMKITDSEHDIVITNVRTGEKYTCTALYLGTVIVTSVFRRIYSVEYPNSEKEEVVPVQPETMIENKENNTEIIEDNTENRENDTEIIEHNTEIKETTTQPEEFYPEPVQMSSICYTCTHNSECKRKTTTCTECSEYINKAEAEKTEEQKYSEEQDRIDRETAKILRKKADEEKIKTLPSEADLRKIHEIKIAHEYYDDVAAGRKRFELRKNDRNYKVNDSLKMTEYKAGEPTGRVLNAVIVYMLEDYTGLEEGYCILGIEMEAQSEEK